MGLFDKKYCDFCGEKIGLLGNRKLADGNMCKKCAAQLSYWFSDRKESTVEEIKGQLAYREANRDIVRNFHATRSFGNGTKLLIDDAQGLFMITRTGRIVEENPDVVALCDIISVNGAADESRHQIHTEGEQQGMPPRYEYSYDFKVVINVNHPYFDHMSIRLNNSSVNTGELRPGDSIPEPFAYGNMPTVSIPGVTSAGGPGPRPGAPVVGAGRPATTAGPRPGMSAAAGRPVTAAGPRPGAPAPGGRQTPSGRPSLSGRPAAPAPAPIIHTQPTAAPVVTPPPMPVINKRGLEDYITYTNMMQEVIAALTPGIGWQ